MMPDIGDIIEIVTDIPEKNLRAGVRVSIATIMIFTRSNSPTAMERLLTSLPCMQNSSSSYGGRKPGSGFRLRNRLRHWLPVCLTKQQDRC